MDVKTEIPEPADKWSEQFLSCLGALEGEIPRPEQQLLQDLKNPFDRHLGPRDSEPN